MKYFKYVFGVFLVLFTLTIFVPNVSAQEVPAGVDSIYREVNFWEKETVSGNQLLVKSNRFLISNIYDYFLFDLKDFNGVQNPGGSLGSSQGIYFFNSVSATSPTDIISFDDLDFDNFIDMSSQDNRWIEFRIVRTIQGTNTESTILYNLNNNIGRYSLSVLAIGSNGLILKDSLYEYLIETIDLYVSNRVDYAYQNGYSTAKNEYGYNYNGAIINGDSAYQYGYQKAIQEAGDTKTDIINFIPGILGAIFMFFFQIGQIGILGITILDVLGIIVLISSLIFVIKFFF